MNDYLEAVQSLFNWMVKVDRAGSNPLARVEKVKTKEGRPKERCAMTIDQVVCLLAVAGERLTGYLMALQTGLRRSELAALKWSDLRLDEGKPFASARASTTKNGKAAAIGLVPELVKVLRELKTTITDEEGPVFATVPRIERFRRDLKKAGIPFRDAQGRSLDFHSLRKTFGTNLARAGVASRAAMELLRHSERKLTDKIYTDETMLGTWSAVNSLPNFSGLASQIASQKLGAEGQNTAFSGTTISSGASAKSAENKTKNPDFTGFSSEN